MPPDPHWIETVFMPVTLALPRLAAIFLVLPFLTRRALPGTINTGLMLLLATFFSPIVTEIPSQDLGAWIGLFVKEALIGGAMGLAFGLFLWVLQSVGDLIDFQTGAANAQFFDPVSEHQGGFTGAYLMQLGIVLFVTAGGLLGLLGAVAESYRVWPIDSYAPKLTRVLELFVIRQGDHLFTWMVKLGGPVLLVLLLVDLGLGLVGRFVSQLDVFTLSMPIKSLLSMLMVALLLTFLFESLQQFLRPDNEVLRFLRSAR